MFLTFRSQEERRAYGGSDFVELQFCRLPRGTEPKACVCVDRIRHWQADSLYVCAYDAFFAAYGGILNCGLYNNLQSGPFDICGVNYYAPEQIDGILDRLHDEQPQDGETLAAWLRQAKRYNGFYILGV